jgi:hypothetical protein
MAKKEIKEEIKEEVKETVTTPNPKEQMIKQRDEYLALLKVLQDEGIVNIGVLENKIASLNKAIG